MTEKYSQRIIEKLDDAGLPRMTDSLDILNICNEYVEERKGEIKRTATRGFAELLQEYFQAVDQDLKKKESLEKQLRRTVKKVLK